MKHFTIDNETNNITVYGSAKEADAAPNSERFSSEATLGKLAADWPAAKLVEIWNSLPGVTPVAKFKDRATAVARIWKALQNLGVTDAVSEAAVAEPAEPAVATPVAQQAPGVAPEAASSGDTAILPENAPAEPAIDKAECDRLLRIAAETQTAYWNALRELERAIGFEIDDPGDLREATVDELMQRRKPVRKARVRHAAAEGTKAPRENSKTSQVIAMLKREGGTTLEEIMTAMGWQKHTTRAMLSAGGSLVKNHGLVVTSEMVGDKRVYSIKS